MFGGSAPVVDNATFSFAMNSSVTSTPMTMGDSFAAGGGIGEQAAEAPSNRRAWNKVSQEELDGMKRMLQAMEKYTYVWQVPVKGRKGPMKPNTTEWRSIAQAATGNPENVKLVKSWYSRVKKAIIYRLEAATMKGIISSEMLEDEKEAGLAVLYKHQQYDLWSYAEYLTKYIICHGDLGVDIDGIYTGSGPEQLSVNQQGTSRNLLQNQPARQNVAYRDLLSGVTGYQQPLACRQLPRILRRSHSEARNDHANFGAAGEFAQPEGFQDHTYAQHFVEYPTGEQGDVAPTLGQIKTEPEDVNEFSQDPNVTARTVQQTEPRPSADVFHPHGHLSYQFSTSATATTMGDVKQEQADEEILRTRNPLEHLLPKNVGSEPHPASHYGLTPEEMEKRVQGFQEFKKFFEEKVAVKSEEEILNFMRVFQQASGSVKDLAQLGYTQEFIAQHVTDKLQNLKL